MNVLWNACATSSKRTQSHFLCTLLFSVYSSSSCSLKKAAFFWATRASRCFLAIFLRLNLKTLITLSETAQQKVHHIIDWHKGTKHSFLCKFHPTQLISPRRIGTPHLKWQLFYAIHQWGRILLKPEGFGKMHKTKLWCRQFGFGLDCLHLPTGFLLHDREANTILFLICEWHKNSHLRGFVNNLKLHQTECVSSMHSKYVLLISNNKDFYFRN